MLAAGVSSGSTGPGNALFKDQLDDLLLPALRLMTQPRMIKASASIGRSFVDVPAAPCLTAPYVHDYINGT